MKACFLIKYPPIEGGVSMRGYWMARDLAERGHQIYVVTNANEVEDEYRMYMDEDDRQWYEQHFESSGGFVKVRHTQPLSDAMMHIPLSNPFVAKLASVATQIIRRHGCEVIFAHYLQPYGLAAYLASLWTGVPFVVKHAGSDLGRLMKQRDLTTAYREVLKAADCVWGGLGEKEPFLAMGVKEENLWHNAPSRVPLIFSPNAPALDLNSLLKKLAANESEHVRNVLINTSPIDLSKPTIGIYGKVGEVKGSFDLLSALGMLKEQGADFNLLAMTQGRALVGFKRAILENDLQDRTWTLPFLPNWKVPGFIRACTAVCFLERDFPISFHGPTVAKEVMACGTCLVLSSEIAEKQQRSLRNSFVSGENMLLVDDPKDHFELAEQLKFVIDNPDKAREIGLGGHKLYRAPEHQAASGGGARAERRFRTSIEVFEHQLEKVRDRRAAQTEERPAERQIPQGLRKERLKARLPQTSALLNGHWERLIEAYCREQPAPPDNQFNDALGMCEFLEARLADLSANRSYFADVLRYEKARNLTFVDVQGDSVSKLSGAAAPIKISFGGKAHRDAADKAPTPPQKKTPGEILNLKPERNRGVVVETFNYDLKGLMSALRQGEVPADLEQEQSFILFKKELNFVSQELSINEATKHLLDLCDGNHSVKEIIGEIANRQRGGRAVLDEDELSRDVMSTVRELVSKGIIRTTNGA